MSGSLASVAGNRLEFSRLSKATLADLSHVLEDLLLVDDLPGVVITGFQAARNWRAEVERYERLAGNPSRSVAIFTNERLRDTGDVIGFTLGRNSALRQEWFIIALTEWFSCALFGVDNATVVGGDIDEMDRLFDATWTFDPTVIADLHALIVREAYSTDPERAAVVERAVATFPPRDVSPAVERRFHRLTFEALESSRKRWRRQLVREQQLNERLLTAETRLLRLERLAAIGTTASSLAHEINNPLSTIRMAADLIVAEMQDPTGGVGVGAPPTSAASSAWVGEHAALISSTVGRIGRMVRGILDLVRAEDVAVQPLELTAWLGLVAEELSVAVGRKVRCDAATPVTVLVDADRLRHVITNLVRNGADADPTEQPILIAISPEDDGRVTVTVTDCGSGVPDEMREAIFQPFVTSRASSGGTGLGLPLARRFVEDLGGSIDLAATGATGTTFAVTLRTAGPVTTPSVGSGRRELAHLDVLAPLQRRALVVDDEPMLRQMLTTTLRRSGWDTVAVSTPDEAAAAVADVAFDVLLVDYRLSRTMTFAEVRARLEAVRPGVSQRMLVITGSLASELTEDDLPQVLCKPFTPAELHEAMSSVISDAG